MFILKLYIVFHLDPVSKWEKNHFSQCSLFFSFFFIPLNTEGSLLEKEYASITFLVSGTEYLTEQHTEGEVPFGSSFVGTVIED